MRPADCVAIRLAILETDTLKKSIFIYELYKDLTGVPQKCIKLLVGNILKIK